MGGVLHRETLFGLGKMGGLVWVNLRLQGAVVLVELRRVDHVGLRQPEQLEVVLLKIETGGLHYTLKLSPQPQESLTLGLLNLKPSFNPSRA